MLCSVHPSLYSSIHPVIQPSIHPSIHRSVHPSIHSSIYLSIRPFIHASICLSYKATVEKLPRQTHTPTHTPYTHSHTWGQCSVSRPSKVQVSRLCSEEPHSAVIYLLVDLFHDVLLAVLTSLLVAGHAVARVSGQRPLRPQEQPVLHPLDRPRHPQHLTLQHRN